jgi:hypothetical protein
MAFHYEGGMTELIGEIDLFVQRLDISVEQLHIFIFVFRQQISIRNGRGNTRSI